MYLFSSVMIWMATLVLSSADSVKLTPELESFMGALEPYATQVNDVVFLIDESGSIGSTTYENVKVFTAMVARAFDVAPSSTRVALVPFATFPRDYVNHIQSGGNMCTLLEKIRTMSYASEGTYTSLAMEMAERILDRGRSNSNKIIILITDGESNNGYKPIDAAKRLRDVKKVVIYSVGVAAINEQEVKLVASSDKHVYVLKNFDYIKEVSEYLRNDTHDHEWAFVPDSSQCNSFCAAGRDCCDAAAKCYCGARSGDYDCVCDAGYYGSGHRNKCHKCSKGTYKSDRGNVPCVSCPLYATTLRTGSESLQDCFCQSGYEMQGSYCKPIKCSKLHAPPGGILIPGECDNTYGSVCSLRCREGFCPYSCNNINMLQQQHHNNVIHEQPWNREPLPSRTCIETGQWTGQDFHCEAMTCSVLDYSVRGKHNCSSLSNVVGTSCQFTCNDGYELSGSSIRTCHLDGKWDGVKASCTRIQCEPLKINLQLKVKPGRCSQNWMDQGSVCQYYCTEGYDLTSNGSISNGNRECLMDKTWSRQDEPISCTDKSPPRITCPPSISVFNDPQKPTAFVGWDQPTANDNVFVNKVYIKQPTHMKKPSHAFSIGETKVVYEAVDSAGLIGSCSFSIRVRDIEPPEVLFCPHDFEVFHAFNSPANVTWDDPIFKDNSGHIEKVMTNVKKGAGMSWGQPNVVNYTAIDRAGNRKSCIFKVTVKPYPCPYLRAPQNGMLACDGWEEGRTCTVHCHEGYQFTFKTKVPKMLMCDQTGSKARGEGQWVSFPRRFPFELPLPDCAKLRTRSAFNTSLTLTYEVNKCSNEVVQMIKKQFHAKVMTVPGGVLCNPQRGCAPENVNVTCSTDSSKVRRAKRSVASDSRNRSVLKISFNMALYPDEGKTETKGKASIAKKLPEKSVISNYIRKQLEAKATKVVKNVYKIRNLKPSRIKYDVVAICLRGQIQANDSCVDCPVGTFKDDFTNSCTDCKTASYQDQENSLMCKPCPLGHMTYQIRSTSLQDCKGPCSTGTYSKNTFEPCSVCPLHTYQDKPSQKGCKKCPQGLETWKSGANSSYDCVSACAPGTFSDTGLEPCEPCDYGYYQTLPHQTSCNSCTNGTTTEKEGTISELQCKEFNVCTVNAACLNGATCTPLEGNAYICLCPYGYVGTHCETPMDFCELVPCLNNGTCVNQDGGYHCQCVGGFSGVNCEENIEDCWSGACLNGGKCIDLISSYKCICKAGYTGIKCEVNINDCDGNPCQNGGTCFDKENDFRCCCAQGYTGRTCETLQDPCLSKTCQNGGTCHLNGTEATCLCHHGTSGASCEVVDDPCDELECLNGGACSTSGNGTAICKCQPLFSGEYCQKALEPSFSLLFPAPPTTSNYVELQNPQTLTSTTVSFFMRTSNKNKDSKRPTPVSYSYFDRIGQAVVDNGMTLYDTNRFILYIHGEMLHTGYVANSDSLWHHYAVTWKSSNGDWSFAVDGQTVVSGSGVGEGMVLWPGVFILGQEQDSLGGTFSSSEAFSGEIVDFNVWNYALQQDEIKRIASSCGYIGNVVRWINAQEHIHGMLTLNKYNGVCHTKGPCSRTSKNCYCIYKTQELRELDDAYCKHSVVSCNPSPCMNGNPCESSAGFSFCNCSDNFEGKLCEDDVNECLVNNGGCSHGCSNTFGSFQCSCPEGLILAEDDKTCKESGFCFADGGEVYLDSEKWSVDCQNCVCKTGAVSCQSKPCDIHSSADCKPNEDFVQFPGSCCPSCVKYSKCTLNVTTPAAEYTILEDCTLGEFSLRLDNTSTLVLYQDCSRLTIDPNHASYENLYLRSVSNGGVLEVWTRSRLYVKWMSDSDTIEVFVPSSDVGTLCGKCEYTDDIEGMSLM